MIDSFHITSNSVFMNYHLFCADSTANHFTWILPLLLLITMCIKNLLCITWHTFDTFYLYFAIIWWSLLAYPCLSFCVSFLLWENVLWWNFGFRILFWNLINKLNQSGLLGVINVSNKKIPGLLLSHKCGLACKPVVSGVC
jgi:hypothetical protein